MPDNAMFMEVLPTMIWFQPARNPDQGSGYSLPTGQFPVVYGVTFNCSNPSRPTSSPCVSYNPVKNLGCGCSKSPTNPYIGEPINVATGDTYVEQEDFAQGDLSLRRYYNSDPNVRAAHSGLQWLNTYDRSLLFSVATTNTATDTPLSPAEVMAQRQDGQELVFNKVNGVWKSDADINDVLTEVDDSNGYVLSWTLFDATTRRYETYSSMGALLSVADASHVLLTLTYTDGTQQSPTGSALPVGLLWSVTDANGRTLTFNYDGQQNLTLVTEPDGGELQYGYNTADDLISVTYPGGTQHQYLYDEAAYSAAGSNQNKLTGIIDESNSRYTTFGYQADGRAISTQEGNGASLNSVSYASSGTAATVTYPLGQQAAATFIEPQGTAVVSAMSARCGEQCSQQYQSQTLDANGYPATATDFNGNITATTYDSNGLLDQQVDASGTSSQRTTTTTWNTTLRLPLTRTVSNASATVVSNTQWVYNATGQALASCDIDPTNSAASGYACAATGTVPAGVRRSTYTYCTAVDTTQCPIVGLLLTATGPRTDLTQTTSYSYYMTSSATNCGTPGSACYQAGDLYQITDAIGHVTTYASYDGAGRVTRITDPNGVNTDMTYTPRGWLASRSVGGSATTFTYMPYGNVKTLTDPDGIVTTFGYDAAHRLTDITDAQGNDIHYTLDAAGHKTAEQISTASGTVVHSLSRSYNALGQLTAVIDGLNQTVFNAGYSDSYDANGNLTHSADGLSIQRQQSYDALNRLVSTLDNYNGTDTATANTTTTTSQDALDRITNVTDPASLVTSYTHDGLSNLTALRSPDSGSSTSTFDAAGNALTHTDAKGVVATSTYDALDRKTSTSYTDTTANVTYTYDEANSVTGCTVSAPIGRPTRVVENTVSTTYCYDARGNVIQKTQVVSGTTDSTSYSYTAADRLSGEITPDGTVISYAFNSNGRISGVQVTPSGSTSASPAVVSSVTWLPFGPISGYTLGNGQVVTRTYDANYRLTDLTSPALALHFGLDAMGDITALGNAPGANPATESYQYDPLYHLISVTNSSGVLESYTYNPTGDRLSKTASGLATGTYSYTSGTHQLASIGSAPRANDANGNTTGSVIGGQTYGFAYDSRQRIALAQANGATVGTYLYNALGQRVYTSATSLRFDYDQAGHVLANYGASSRDYIWLDDLPVATVDSTINGSAMSSTVNYVIADQLDTPRAVINSAGTLIWSWAYAGNPFGEQQPTSTGYTLNLRYPGQWYDAETGTADNGYRTFESYLGRYAQTDPTGFNGGISTYAYVGNNPFSFVDPSGLARHKPDSLYCQNLANKIKNVSGALDNRWQELDSDKDTLEEYKGPGESLFSTRRGHRTLINKYDRNLRDLQDKYDDECGPPPPPTMCPALSPNESPEPSNVPKVTPLDEALLLLLGAGAWLIANPQT
ncbi:RHS repeat-associated core domain-containing protein [Rhodanobacter sp. A1T4]|uniref:RHS repeat-associated core domain-containing protein n=1 Tax=Rhodanobacter sp. A1T4 TaxID=2723087 RepID=UPI00161D026E|nr:RHS repeat-associated core domain-containing protein [Rhodanobacter sp. A1T4]MBB6248265.1 RHS repeat-associated protein [Rhodanobacter sp. A1T4]